MVFHERFGPYTVFLFFFIYIFLKLVWCKTVLPSYVVTTKHILIICPYFIIMNRSMNGMVYYNVLTIHFWKLEFFSIVKTIFIILWTFLSLLNITK